MNTLFIQFYATSFGNVIKLFNGFSDSYNYCKNLGDFLWVDVNKVDELELPFKKGKVYISVFFFEHLHIVYNLGKKYPDIKFICGGPIIQTYKSTMNELFVSKIDIPNIELVTLSVEEYFNIPNYSIEWNLNLDGIKNLSSYKFMMFTYQIISKCYWAKCTFCSYPGNPSGRRININLDCLNKIDFPGQKLIQVNSPCLDKKFIDEVFPKLKNFDDIQYVMLLRCDKSEIENVDFALQRFKDNIPNIKFRLGIEFPSNRMLKFMNKGITLNNILNALKMFRKYEGSNIQLYLLLMTAWPNIKKSDLINFDTFADNIINPVTAAVLSPLFCPVGSEVHNEFKNIIKTHEYSGPFYRGYIPKITKEVEEVDSYIFEVMKTKAKKLYYLNTKYSTIDADIHRLKDK